jgi:N-acetylglucosaminyl-diphospho-decaprenol L-rhamnosyltransferase
MTDVSVIVVDINGGEMLRQCLASIDAQTSKPLEVLVHDNSVTNIGFAAGVNAAYAKSHGEYVALVNNDAVLDRDWLETVVRAMDDPQVAAVQTIIRRDERTIDGAGIDVSDGTFRQGLHGCSVAELLGDRSNPATQQPSNPAWGVSATAALYRRAAIGERFFDERFFAYYEDVDLCARLHEEGWSTCVLPVIKATHRGSASASVLGKDALRLRTRNRYWVARRHRGVGRIGALLFEDLKKGPSIARIRGVWEGLLT